MISETLITAYNDFGLSPIDPEIADNIDWKRHACRRTCKDNAAPLDCYYTFKLESYYAMSKACYDCPFNITDCFRPHCIPTDGMKRSLLVVNRQMPGPAIEVRNVGLRDTFYGAVLIRDRFCVSIFICSVFLSFILIIFIFQNYAKR